MRIRRPFVSEALPPCERRGLSLAIGGTNGGDPSETEFPSRYEIDYVRVYQKATH